MLEPGQIFAARYRVKRRIAEGGMGAIFEAEHTATERCVALKLLFPHIMSVASAREKFELEAKVSARVNSPYIVQVLDAGFDEVTQSPYLVMELLSGETLATHVRERGPLDADEARRLLQQVATGLDSAHGYKEPNGARKPIVHRDLKPENLFVTRQHDGSVLVKILDFGIAKVLGDTGNVSQEVRGTPLYMAFEQVTAGRLSPETDVWSLGLIAYYVLTGRRYWRSAEQAGASVQSLFAEILTLPMEAPSIRLKQQQVGIELPAAFDAWLLKCLDREPSNRFHSAGVAIEQLGRAFERAPRARSLPAPKLTPALSFGATATFQAPFPPTTQPRTTQSSTAQPSTAASLPAIATDRGSFSVRSRWAKSKSPLAAAVGGGILIALALLWSRGKGDPASPKAAAAAPTPATATDIAAPTVPALPLRVEPEPKAAPAEPQQTSSSGEPPAWVADAPAGDKEPIVTAPSRAATAVAPKEKDEGLSTRDPVPTEQRPSRQSRPAVLPPDKPSHPSAVSLPPKARVLTPSKAQPKGATKPSSAYDTR